MKKVDQWIAIGSIVFSVIVLFLIPSQISTVGSSVVGMSARTFPRFASISIIVCSVLMLINSFISTDDTPAPVIIRKSELKVLLILGVILAYAIISQYLGFLLSTCLVGCAYIIICNDKVWYHYLIYCVTVFACYYLFTKVLYIHLPKMGVWIF